MSPVIIIYVGNFVFCVLVCVFVSFGVFGILINVHMCLPCAYISNKARRKRETETIYSSHRWLTYPTHPTYNNTEIQIKSSQFVLFCPFFGLCREQISLCDTFLYRVSHSFMQAYMRFSYNILLRPCVWLAEKEHTTSLSWHCIQYIRTNMLWMCIMGNNWINLISVSGGGNARLIRYSGNSALSVLTFFILCVCSFFFFFCLLVAVRCHPLIMDVIGFSLNCHCRCRSNNYYSILWWR